MLDHMILTVSNLERSLAFYEAALKPLNIKFFLPYKGEGDRQWNRLARVVNQKVGALYRRMKWI
jgi:catechol 2,3-dioxygenase-like lactoylglutathione lyase family enzyme